MKITGIGLTPGDLGFPFKLWREYQLEVAETILNSTKRVIVLQAPTGIGKSAIVQIPQRITNHRQVILTRTKQLQSQYETDGVLSLYGRENYICNRFPVLTAAQGICHLGQQCHLRYAGCDYYDQKRLAVASTNAVLNYSYFFREANGPGQFSNLTWAICDEGHSVPNELAASYRILLKISAARRAGLRPPKSDASIEEWIQWANKIYGRVKGLANRATAQNAKDIEALFRAVSGLDRIADPDNWVSEGNKWWADFRPIWVDSLARTALWPHASRWLFTSATIDAPYVMSQLGMSMDEVLSISVPSIFPVSARPLLICPEYSINHNSGDKEWNALVGAIDRVMSRFPGRRGLIHTGNYRLAQIIKERSNQSMRMIVHATEDRANKLSLFKSDFGQGKVLVSPSMTEGVDLPYDLCAFQVIAKLPWPDQTNKLWVARMDSDPVRMESAYISETISSITQAYGRGTRAEDDKSTTVILDRSFNRLWNKHRAQFPGFFKEAVQIISNI